MLVIERDEDTLQAGRRPTQTPCLGKHLASGAGDAIKILDVNQAPSGPGHDRRELLPTLEAGAVPVAINKTQATLDHVDKMASIHEMGEHEQAERELAQLSWVLRGLCRSNAAAVRASNEQTLYQFCCDAITSVDSYPLAWIIGVTRENGACTIDCVVASGTTRDYLHSLVRSWTDGSLFSKGPVAMAIRSGQTQVIHGLDLASMIAVPIRTKSGIVGVMVVHGRKPHTFSVDAVTLLESLAVDIAYGVASRRGYTAYLADLASRSDQSIKRSAISGSAATGSAAAATGSQRGERARILKWEGRTAMHTRHAIKRTLCDAIRTSKLTVVYEDIVSLTDRHLVGAEALLRWLPEVPLNVPVERVIKVAEETGLIVPIGQQVIRKVLGVLADRLVREKGLTLFVNLSPKQILCDGLVSFVRKALYASGVGPEQVAFELTETARIEELERVRDVLHALRALGCRTGLDDFGTGWSSLVYLQTLPIDFVKLDRSFITPLAECKRTQAIVSAVVSLARGLGITTIAEGIETQTQQDAARRLGCDLAQGFLFGMPQPQLAYMSQHAA